MALGGPLQHDGTPLSYGEQAEVLAQINTLTSDAAQVFTDIESTLGGLRQGLAFVLGEDGRTYIDSHVEEVRSVRESILKLSSNPIVVHEIWEELIGSPTPAEETPIEEMPVDVDTPAAKEAEAEEKPIPTAEDVMSEINTILGIKLTDAIQMWQDITKTFEPLISHEGEFYGLNQAEIAMNFGSLKIREHLRNFYELLDATAVEQNLTLPIFERK